MKKRIVLASSILFIILIISILYLFSNWSQNDSKISAEANARKLLQNKKIHPAYDGMTLEVKKKIEKVPVLQVNYNLNGKDNEAYYNALDYGVVLDTSYHDLNVFCGHDYSFFANLGKLKVGDIVTIKKNGKIKKYEVFETKTVDKSDADAVYNDEFINKEGIITLYTCEAKNGLDSFKPSNRIVVHAKEIIE